MYPSKVGFLYTQEKKYLIDASKVKDLANAINDSKNAGIRLENYQRRIPRFDVINIEVKEVNEGMQQEIDVLKSKSHLRKTEQESIWLDEYIAKLAIN